MQVFCPNCGQANETRPDGGKVMCTACTSVFDVPAGGRRAPPPPPPPPPPAAAPQGYAPPPPPPPAGYAPPPPPPVGGAWQGTSGTITPGAPVPGMGQTYSPMAIASLVTSLLCCLPGLPIILGMKAIRDIDASAHRLKGKELAIVGMVFGGLGLAWWALVILGAIVGES